MINKKISTMLEAIKEFFLKSNGILLLHKYDSPSEVNDYYREVTNDLEMKKISEDKKNMKIDSANLKKDIKKSIATYSSEFCNG